MLPQPKTSRAPRMQYASTKDKVPPCCRLGQGAGSGASFVDHFFPNAFGLEDELDEFAGGAFSAVGLGGVVGGAADFGRGVVNGDCQPHALQDLQVGQVIAKE